MKYFNKNQKLWMIKTSDWPDACLVDVKLPECFYYAPCQAWTKLTKRRADQFIKRWHRLMGW